MKCDSALLVFGRLCTVNCSLMYTGKTDVVICILMIECQLVYQAPVHLQEDRQIGCLCCVSGTMTATAQTDRGGYCPGEIVGISVYVNNRSRSDIPGIRLSICQYVEFIASTGKLKMQIKQGPCSFVFVCFFLFFGEEGRLHFWPTQEARLLKPD